MFKDQGLRIKDMDKQNIAIDHFLLSNGNIL